MTIFQSVILFVLFQFFGNYLNKMDCTTTKIFQKQDGSFFQMMQFEDDNQFGKQSASFMPKESIEYNSTDTYAPDYMNYPFFKHFLENYPNLGNDMNWPFKKHFLNTEQTGEDMGGYPGHMNWPFNKYYLSTEQTENDSGYQDQMFSPFPKKFFVGTNPPNYGSFNGWPKKFFMGMISEKLKASKQNFLVGVNPAYFDNSCTTNHGEDFDFYATQFESNFNEFAKTHSFVKMSKFTKKFGIAKVEFAQATTFEQMEEAFDTVFTTQNKVFFVESDQEVIHPRLTDLRTLQTNPAIPEPFQPTKPACPNPEYYSSDPSAPNDPDFPKQWYMQSANDYHVDALEFWAALSNTVEPNVIGVSDSGLDYTMDDFSGSLWVNPGETYTNDLIDQDGNGYADDVHGWNFDFNNSFIWDFNSHGTMCSGIIAAQKNDNIHMAGISPNSKICVIKSGTVGGAIEGLNYMIDMNIKVSSNSWYINGTESEALKTAIETAGSYGHLFVTGTGNDAHDMTVYPKYPANYNLPNMLNVGASNYDGYTAYFSNYGSPYCHVVAPGDCMFTTVSAPIIFFLKDKYGWVSGTSFSTPLTAGIASELFAQFPSLTYDQVKQAIMNSCKPGVNFDTQHTQCGGIVSAYNAYMEAYNMANPTTTA